MTRKKKVFTRRSVLSNEELPCSEQGMSVSPCIAQHYQAFEHAQNGLELIDLRFEICRGVTVEGKCRILAERVGWLHFS